MESDFVTEDWQHGVTCLRPRQYRFRIWAPAASRVELVLACQPPRLLPLEARQHGYFETVVDDLAPGALYRFRLDGALEQPDPASRSQPQGVHGPSQLVDHSFEWRDQEWRGRPLSELIFYELHIGTFTPEGTFDAVIPHLDYLRELGVTALELMPVAQFPGSRNWGYDGVYPFAVQDSYGGPAGLKRLVDACHRRGLAVVLDVVYNHLGPEGNYLGRLGPYFTDRYQTPWGSALNFDGPGSDEVRRFFVENALYWVTEFHIDGLRLDAVHAIFDQSAYSFLEELGDAVRGRALVIPESDLNDPRLVRGKESGGLGLDAQWSDDFHHSLRALLTGERGGYYQDFGQPWQLARAFEEGFVYGGEYSAHRQRRHGRSSRGLPPRRLVVFSQNHDQVGNRMLGERLGVLAPFESLKLAAVAVLLSPYLPLLFMGQEYGETAPFLYFVSHTDPHLMEAVRQGRKREFAAFAWQGEPPDPRAEETFLSSKLDHRLRRRGRHAVLLEFHRELIALRRGVPALARLSREETEVTLFERQRTLRILRRAGRDEAMILLCFAASPVAAPAEGWRKVFDSEEPRWMGRGSLEDGKMHPRSAAVYRKEEGAS